MILRLLCVLLVLPIVGTAQNVVTDSLKKCLADARDDSTRWYYTLQLSAAYHRVHFDTSKMYGEQSLALSGDFGKGSCKAQTLNTLGATHWAKGDHETALKYYFEALNISEPGGFKLLASTTLGNIGLVYSDRNDAPRALEYLQKSLVLKRSLRDTLGIVRTMNNLGRTFLNNAEQPDSALVYFNACLPLFDALPGQIFGKGIILNNIGTIFLNKKDYSRAREYFNQSLQIREKLGDKGGQSVVLGNLGELAFEEGIFAQAIDFYERSLAFARATGSDSDQADIWEKLSKAYAAQNNFPKAYEYLQKYAFWQDTLHRRERERSIADMEVKYQTEKKEAEIRDLENQQRIQKILTYSALGGILALLVVLWLSRRTYRQRRLLQQATIDRLESERKVVALNAHLEGQQLERLRIAEDLHDDFGSGLSKISLLSEVAKKKTSLTELDKIAATAKELLLKMSEIVWALNHHNDTLPSLAAYIRRYAVGFFEDSGVRCHFNIPDLPEAPLSGETRRNIFLVVKESLHNILKHAGATKVQIDFLLKNNNLEIKICDDGQGFDEAALVKAGNGLLNMKKRMKATGGSFDVESTPQKGVTVRLGLPLVTEEIAVSAQAA